MTTQILPENIIAYTMLSYALLLPTYCHMLVSKHRVWMIIGIIEQL
jgi:hypothetical protein